MATAAGTMRPRGSEARPSTGGPVLALEREAHGLADRMPELLVEASRIAATVAHGVHGRRRAGTGETFWQFRHYQGGDSAQLIDWRRSASTDALFVREREWEAAHTLWMWPDLSPSMEFRSHLAAVTKRERALVLTLAAAEILVRGGERVALIGLTRPTASRKAATRIAETIAGNLESPVLSSSLPPKTQLSRFSGVLLVSDFLDPIDDLRASIEAMAANGVSGHIVQVLDPAEETLPYEGRTEFIGVEGGERWVADRADALRQEFQARMRAHRASLADIARRLGWTFLVHHTDRPASEPLLALVVALSGTGHAYKYAPANARNPEPEA